MFWNTSSLSHFSLLSLSCESGFVIITLPGAWWYTAVLITTDGGGDSVCVLIQTNSPEIFPVQALQTHLWIKCSMTWSEGPNTVWGTPWWALITGVCRWSRGGGWIEVCVFPISSWSLFYCSVKVCWRGTVGVCEAPVHFSLLQHFMLCAKVKTPLIRMSKISIEAMKVGKKIFCSLKLISSVRTLNSRHRINKQQNEVHKLPMRPSSWAITWGFILFMRFIHQLNTKAFHSWGVLHTFTNTFTFASPVTEV